MRRQWSSLSSWTANSAKGFPLPEENATAGRQGGARWGGQRVHVLAILEYDGTAFAGFQIQAHARSVQGEFERVLWKVTGERLRVTGGGRTDAGVHARGQSATFTTGWNRPLPVLGRALNALLPDDLAVRELYEVPPHVSARYSARSRLYRYTILNRPPRSPLHSRYALMVADPLDTAAMQDAADLLVGEHDFRSFGSSPKGEKTVRRLVRASVQREGSRVTIDLEANAFLYRMVRRLVGTLILVGRRRISPAQVLEVLQGARRPGPAVKPNGLCLVRVRYDLDELGIGPGRGFLGERDEDIFTESK